MVGRRPGGGRRRRARRRRLHGAAARVSWEEAGREETRWEVEGNDPVLTLHTIGDFSNHVK